MKRLTTLLLIGMFVSAVAMADDVDDVKAAVTKFYQQLNDGDLDSLAFLAPGNSFPRTGSLLESLPPSRSEAQAGQDAGQDWDLTLRHLDAKVYGDSAVATYYTVGTATYPDGTVVRGVHRASIMLIKQGGQWRQVHSHISPLISPNELEFQTKRLSADYDYLAPDGSEIRLLPNVTGGGLAHDTLPPGKVSVAVRHQTVEEIWYFIEGEGEVWRKQGDREEVVSVRSGASITIPVGTHFQFRNTGEEALKFLISTMPPWPGASEAIEVEGHW